MINNLHDLKAEKSRLQKQKAALEAKLSKEWSSIKKLTQAGSSRFNDAGKQLTSSFTIRELVKTGVRYGIGLLARKMADRASGKIDKFI
jgi:hypothetical protein